MTGGASIEDGLLTLFMVLYLIGVGLKMHPKLTRRVCRENTSFNPKTEVF